MSGRQYEHLFTTTVVLAAALIAAGTDLAEARFISFDGNYADPAAGGLKDAIGVSKGQSYQGAVPVLVGYTAILEMAEGGKPVSLRLYKVEPGVLQNWALINDASSLAGLPWSGKVLADTSRPANGDMGQIGQFIQVV